MIKATAAEFGRLTRTELAATLCENLPWRAPNGRLRIDSCRVLLEGLADDGVVALPAKQARAPRQPRSHTAGAVADRPLRGELAAIRPVTVEPVPAGEGGCWDATMAAYHPLGFRRAFGAHQRYWVRSRAGILGGLLFAASAKAVAARDDWIGWGMQERGRYRFRIVANSRYLLLPGVRIPHLASHVLALAVRRLAADWRLRYGYEPVLVETFTEPPYNGTCYRAANWLHVGETAGRGRQDRAHRRTETVKQVWVYPLRRDWRQALVAPVPEGVAADA